MRLKKIAFKDPVAIGGKLSGMSFDGKDFVSITLDGARTTIAFEPKGQNEEGETEVYLVPWSANVRAAIAIKPPAAKAAK